MNRSTPVQHIERATMADTLRAMRAAAHAGKKDLVVRRLVEQITEGIAQGDYASEALAIYYWVCKNIRYIRDIDGVELLKTPQQLLRTRAGDCDDMATLLAAMLMAAGNPVRFAIAGFRPGVYSHVYVELLTPHGPVAIDPVANRVTDRMLKDMKAKDVFPVSQGPGTVDAGIGERPVGALRHMGPSGGNVYSIYDYNRGVYEYFEAPTGAIAATGQYRKFSASSRFGAPPEALASKLPANAKKVGEGDAPRGFIASPQTGGLFGGLQLPTHPVVVLLGGIVVGYILYDNIRDLKRLFS